MQVRVPHCSPTAMAMRYSLPSARPDWASVVRTAPVVCTHTVNTSATLQAEESVQPLSHRARWVGRNALAATCVRVCELRSELLDHNASGRVDEDVIAITVLAGGGVITVTVTLRVNHLIARKSLQGDAGPEIPAERLIVGRNCAGRAERRQQWKSKNKQALAHGYSRCWNQILANFFGSLSTPQMDSREEDTAAAREGSSS